MKIQEIPELSTRDLEIILIDWKIKSPEFVAIAIYSLQKRGYHFAGGDLVKGYSTKFCESHNIQDLQSFVNQTAVNYGYQTNVRVYESQDIKKELQKIIDIKLIKEAGYSIKKIVNLFLTSIIVVTITIALIMINPRNGAGIYLFHSIIQTVLFIVLLIRVSSIGNKFVNSIKND